MPSSSSPAVTPFRRATRFALVVGWASLIYAASDRPDLRIIDDDLLDLVLRKAAHLFVFGVLAVFIARAVRGEGSPIPTALGAAWIATLAYAASDEWHQTHVVGRVGHASDVLIDLVGATIALALLRRAWRRSANPSREASV